MTSIPWNFSWFIDGKLAGMAYPRDKHVPFLLASGLQTIVNLTPFPADYEDTAKTHGITVYNITIEDFEAPSYDQIKYFLDICRNAETPVAVHCGKGMGRTGTMLACYLAAKEGLKAADAIMETRHRRIYSIETEEQERAVFEFERKYSRRGAR